MSLLDKKFLFWNQLFKCLQIVVFQLQLVYLFPEKFLEKLVLHGNLPSLILATEKGFCYPNVPTHLDLNRKKNDKE